MGSVQQKLSGVKLALVAGAMGISLLAMACAPPPSTGGGTTTTTTTTTSTTLPWSTPTGQWTSFDMTCGVNVLGTNYTFPQSASVNVDAPATVNAGDTFDMTIAPGAFNVPTVVQGFALEKLVNFTIRFPLSPNVQFVDSVMSAGFNMGPGYPSLTVQGGYLVYKVPGAFVPGSTVQMPKDRLTFKAVGPSGSKVDIKLFNLTNTVSVSGVNLDVSCHLNDPNLIFWTTTIA